MLTGRQTGYPSVDKPWLKYFTPEQINEMVPSMSLYEFMYNSNENYSEKTVMEYLGKKYKYKDLFRMIGKASSAFFKLGVKTGDIVTFCSITTPEVIASFYALNKLGAIANMVDLRYTPEAIKEYLLESESKLLVILDICYPLVDAILPETKVEKVIVISPTNGANSVIRIVSNLKSRKSIRYGNQYLSWADFIGLANDSTDISVSYEANRATLMVHTGGTTGVPKGVLLSNENILNAIIQIKNANAHCRRGWRFLNILPPFVAYGMVLGINIPISLGWYSIIIPKFEVSQFEKLLRKYKPNGVMGVPIYWENVMKSSNVNKLKLDSLEDILIGGDKIPVEFENRLNKFLSEHNCRASVGKGYSMTEVSACTTFSSYKSNVVGSVGVPLTRTCVASFEPGTTQENKYGIKGELCIKTPTMMLGYFKNEEATKAIIKEHSDGKWVHTGDIGYVDENGFVYVVDRIKRIIPRSGFKVFPSEIENLFLKHPGVEQCAVVAIPDDQDVNAPKAHIVLKRDCEIKSENVKTELLEMLRKSALPPYFEPVEFKFRDSLPLTKIGKIDFRMLQKEDELITTLK